MDFTLRAAILAGLAALLCLPLCGCGKDGPSVESHSPVSTEAPVISRVLHDQPAPVAAGNVAFRLDGEDLALDWTYELPGDFNRDLAVNGMDVFPLALHFGHSSSHAGGERTDDSDDCIDGNRDGSLDGLDLFVIAVNFEREAGTLKAYHRLGDTEFTEDDVAGQFDPAGQSPPSLPLCAREFSLNLGAAGAEVHLGRVRTVVDAMETDSAVVSWPELTGAMVLDGDPQGEIPCFIDFSVELIGGTPPFTYAWDFGDGFTNGLEAPTHDYVSAGPFEPTVTVTDSLGLELFLTCPALIEPAPKSAKERIAVASPSMIYMMDSDGGNIEELADFSIDTSDILVLSNDLSTLLFKDSGRLWVIDTETKEMNRIAEELYPQDWRMPTMTGDGEWFLIENENEPDNYNTYLVNRDGSSITKVFEDIEQDAAQLSGEGGRIFTFEIVWEGDFDPLETIYYQALLPDLVPVELSDTQDGCFGSRCISYDGKRAIGGLMMDLPDSPESVMSIMDIESHTINPVIPTKGLYFIDLACDGDARKVIYISGSVVNEYDIVSVAYTDGSASNKIIWQNNGSKHLALSMDGSEVFFRNRGFGLYDNMLLFRVSADGLDSLNLNQATGIEDFYNYAIPGSRRLSQ